MIQIDLALLFFAAVLNALMDALHHGSRWVDKVESTSFFGRNSWRRKWKNFDPEQGPAFPGSTTVFVFLTDGWHLAKTLMLLCIFVAGATSWIDVVIIYALWSIVFECSYRLMRKR